VFRLDLNGVDWAILISHFVVVLGIGFAAKRYVKTGLDYFLSGRSLPAWITGLAFIAANLGALEVIGQAANGAQYGVASVHFYWIGAGDLRVDGPEAQGGGDQHQPVDGPGPGARGPARARVGVHQAADSRRGRGHGTRLRPPA
jgi:Sodium:solute symporter family